MNEDGVVVPVGVEQQPLGAGEAAAVKIAEEGATDIVSPVEALLELATFATGDSLLTETSRQRMMGLLLDDVLTQKESSIEGTETETDGSKKKLEATEAFFTTQNESFGMTPLERITQAYDHLDSAKVEEVDISAHAREVLRLAVEQHLENPEFYVSHGFDHSLRVTDRMQQSVDQNPQILTAIQQKYGIDAGQARFAIDMVGFFHDFGYPYVGERGKAVHALIGADILGQDEIEGFHARLLGQEPGSALIHDIKEAVLFHSADKVEQVYQVKVRSTRGDFLTDTQDIVRIVRTLTEGETTAQVVDAALTIEVGSQELYDQIRDALLISQQEAGLSGPLPEIRIIEGGAFKGRKIDLEHKGDQLLGLEFSQIDILDSPLHGLIRLADNLDMMPERFSELQNNPAFREIYHRMGDTSLESARALVALEEAQKRVKKGAATEIQTLDHLRTQGYTLEFQDDALDLSGMIQSHKQRIVDAVLLEPAYTQLTAQERSEIARISLKQNSESFRHFGGCEALQTVQLTGDRLVISVDEEKFQALNGTKVHEYSLDDNGYAHGLAVGVGEYQIWRAYSAYQSLRLGTKPVEIEVRNQHGQPIPGFENYARDRMGLAELGID